MRSASSARIKSTGSSGRLTGRSTHRVDREYEIIRKREKEMQHQLEWSDRSKYYEKFDKNNSKFETWTSPRYYEANTEQWEKLKEVEKKHELLEKRREKLRKLYAEEEASFNIEVRAYHYLPFSTYLRISN